MHGEVFQMRQGSNRGAEWSVNKGVKAISVTDDGKDVLAVQDRARLTVHLLRGLQGCGNSMAVIAAEWKLGWLESHLGPALCLKMNL